MFTDARSIAAGSTLQADICIVGAGVAGITIAREFIGRPERVVLLEGGGLEFTKSLRELPTVLRRHTLGEQALTNGRNAGQPYYPLRFTRVRAFGGSSRAWHEHRGVHARPLDAIDFETRDGLPEHGWPIDRAQLGLFGISAGGFFGTWVMFQPNTPFNKYIISSPAMAFGSGEAFRQEADYAKTHKDLAVGVYLAAGSLEATTPEVEVLGETVSGMSRLAGVLASRHYPGLKLTVEYHPGMNHNDVMGTTVVRGLRTLYAK